MASQPGRWYGVTIFVTVTVLFAVSFAEAQASSARTGAEGYASAQVSVMQQLQLTVSDLQAQVSSLQAQIKDMQAMMANRAGPDAPDREAAHNIVDPGPHGPSDGVDIERPQTGESTLLAKSGGAPLSAEDRGILDYLKTATTNVMFDGYYSYNFNDPVGRVNLLRAYDVSSNAFSLNQAAVVFERAADPEAGRRWGTRLDLQFGQATATLQGNPANEHRPDIYRNIFQAYGTYVIPAGKGINVDFGKWASSLGYEGNYTKDQMNYSRSYWFNFLPFYHMGFRVSYPVNNKLELNYWLINGSNQTEPTNEFKDEMFGFVLTPGKNITWTMNYYFGQENPDSRPVANCGPVPVQPGLCFVAVTPASDGKLQIFDSYVNWQAARRWTFALEGDYVIQRIWADAAPGKNSAPAHTWGGAAYAKYQLTPNGFLAARAEYLSDHGSFFTGGLFSGVTEALKEVTLTYSYNVAHGLQLKTEWRRDWSNVPIFLTSTQNVFSKDQNTATLGLIWWFGRKQGAW
jgi:hypothetical protein